MRSGTIRIGISGWRYGPWRGDFYPEDLPQRRELSFAANKFSTIEINGTFYSLRRPDHFQRWFEETPDDFVFAVKGSRYVTHMLRLKNVGTPLANFFASGILALEQKLGPILWQLPARFRFDPERLAAFFEILPRSSTEAAELARHHDKRLSGRARMRTGADRPLRHAIEIRHDSFCTPEFIRLLRKHRIGLVIADTVEWPGLMDVTADFVYCQLHGSRQLYASGYGPKVLDKWAALAIAWASGREADGEHVAPVAPKRSRRDVFIYFDNDVKARAPRNARSLARKVAALEPG